MMKNKVVLARRTDTWDLVPQILFGIAVVAFLCVSFFNVQQPLLERHGFRQTQTALTSFWMLREQWTLAYQTPVVGAPWSIPFEFPVYQAVVATISLAAGTPLDATGRLVSALCALAVCAPVFKSLRLVGVERGAAWLACACYLTTPVYLFWSGTFMIESTALLFTTVACYLLLVVRQNGPSPLRLLAFTIFLTAAMLQKITTALVPAALGALLLVVEALPRTRHIHGSWITSQPLKNAIKIGFAMAVAVAVAYAWVRFSDQVKSQNAFGQSLTSSALAFWNYGSWELRVSERFWKAVFERMLFPSTAWGVGLVALALHFFLPLPKRPKVVAACAVLLFVAPIGVFANLHFVHDYYQTANLLYLAVACAISVHSVSRLLPARAQPIAAVAMFCLIGSNLWWFHQIYWKEKTAKITLENSRSLRLANYLRTNTPPDGKLLIFGLDWSSEVPYYAERKSLAVPPWTGLELDVARDPNRYLREEPAGAISCPAATADQVRLLLQQRWPAARVDVVNDCTVYLISTTSSAS